MVIFFISIFPIKAFGEEKISDDGLELAKGARSAIMIEASTGRILYEKNKDEKLAMASMTKMMTLLLIMEEIEKGNLKWDEMVMASDYAASMGGSQIFLEPGEKMSVEDLVKGICIASGNDASVAMAERIGGTEENFVRMMNDKAKALGLSNTHFENACGLDHENHYSSAYDMSVIARELVSHERILKYTGTYEDYLRKNTDNSFWLVNTNRLVRYYQGVDGLKTGYTKNALYCITTTAKRGEMRLITVVMGEESSSVRNQETTSMLDYGFSQYSIDRVIDKKTVLGRKNVFLGKEKNVEIVPAKDYDVLKKKSDGEIGLDYQVSFYQIKAPVKVGDVVGKISILSNGKVIDTIDATVGKSVLKKNIIQAYFEEFISLVKGDGSLEG